MGEGVERGKGNGKSRLSNVIYVKGRGGDRARAVGATEWLHRDSNICTYIFRILEGVRILCCPMVGDEERLSDVRNRSKTDGMEGRAGSWGSAVAKCKRWVLKPPPKPGPPADTGQSGFHVLSHFTHGPGPFGRPCLACLPPLDPNGPASQPGGAIRGCSFTAEWTQRGDKGEPWATPSRAQHLRLGDGCVGGSTTAPPRRLEEQEVTSPLPPFRCPLIRPRWPGGSWSRRHARRPCCQTRAGGQVWHVRVAQAPDPSSPESSITSRVELFSSM
ncbi:hypothetical protein QBC39DRAFT_107432 [Podospora conica]|nr:hypothetical protein QBC39DRAFT_107432 [Schizothecium conicum]